MKRPRSTIPMRTVIVAAIVVERFAPTERTASEVSRRRRRGHRPPPAAPARGEGTGGARGRRMGGGGRGGTRGFPRAGVRAAGATPFLREEGSTRGNHGFTRGSEPK